MNPGKKKLYKMNNPKFYSPAFPPIPSQDQFGRYLAVFPGMSLLDYATIKIYSANCDKLTFLEAVNLAKDLLNVLYEEQSNDNLQPFIKAE